MNVRRLSTLLVVITVIALFGCGGGKPRPRTDPTLKSIVVTPTNSKMTIGRSSTQQFTATGSYSDGSTRDLTASATWNSSDRYIAAVSATGAVSVNSAGTATISAKAGSVTGSTTLTVRALNSISITPSGATLAVSGGIQQFTAAGVFSDGTNEDLTSTATWASSNAAAATVNSQGLVSAGGESGFSRIDATCFSVTGSTAVSVTDQHFSDASLNGEYVLTLTGSDARGPNWIAGRIRRMATVNLRVAETPTMGRVTRPASGSPVHIIWNWMGGGPWSSQPAPFLPIGHSASWSRQTHNTLTWFLLTAGVL
jgi:hypothetical protein